MKTLFQSIKITIAFCVILSVGYVLVLWGAGALIQSNGGQAELVTANGRVVGAVQVGQSFSDSIYFWGRPSAVEYDGGGSGASNKGVANPEYLSAVEGRMEAFLAAHPYLTREEVPSELVTASGSGLDPHLSPEGAAVQIERVAAARGLQTAVVAEWVEQYTERPWLGKPFVHLLKLNAALDQNQTK